jgi:hypothetical protein
MLDTHKNFYKTHGVIKSCIFWSFALVDDNQLNKLAKKIKETLNESDLYSVKQINMQHTSIVKATQQAARMIALPSATLGFASRISKPQATMKTQIAYTIRLIQSSCKSLMGSVFNDQSTAPIVLGLIILGFCVKGIFPLLIGVSLATVGINLALNIIAGICEK